MTFDMIFHASRLSRYPECDGKKCKISRKDGLVADIVFEDGKTFSTLLKNLTPISNTDQEDDQMLDQSNNESRPGKMSGDRVHFTIPARYLTRKSYIALLRECFGIYEGAFDKSRDLNVICRPSQFARFIVLRHTKHGEENNMAGLNMKLVSPAPPPNTIDCSRNANTAIGVAA